MTRRIRLFFTWRTQPTWPRVTTMRAATSVPSLVPSPVMLLHQPCLHAHAHANLSLHYGIQRICARNLLLRLVPACCQLRGLLPFRRKNVGLCGCAAAAVMPCCFAGCGCRQRLTTAVYRMLSELVEFAEHGGYTLQLPQPSGQGQGPRVLK